MKTLEQFKAENNIGKITFLQGKGRPFAKIGDKSLVISKNADTTKPLFVIPLKDKNENMVENAYVLCNSTATVAMEL